MTVISRVARCLSTAPQNTQVIAQLKECVDKWPADSSKGFRDIRIHLQQRAHILIDTNDPVQIEKEIKGLELLISNHYRDKYLLPKGLGGPPPLIAATGLDLETVSSILTNKEASRPKNGLLARALRIFS